MCTAGKVGRGDGTPVIRAISARYYLLSTAVGGKPSRRIVGLGLVCGWQEVIGGGLSAREKRRDAAIASAREEFAALFAERRTTVRRYLERGLSNDDDVDDVLGDVFMLAWVKFDPKRPFRLAWLLKVADNKLRDHERGAKARARLFDAIGLMSVPGAGRADVLDHLAVRQAVATLNQRERSIVELIYSERLSAGEVAVRLGCSQAAVNTALSRARTKLRAQLATESDAAPPVSTTGLVAVPRGDS